MLLPSLNSTRSYNNIFANFDFSKIARSPFVVNVLPSDVPWLTKMPVVDEANSSSDETIVVDTITIKTASSADMVQCFEVRQIVFVR